MYLPKAARKALQGRAGMTLSASSASGGKLTAKRAVRLTVVRSDR